MHNVSPRSTNMDDKPLHIVLLGDSILDNGPYVARHEAVSDHLREQLGARGRATLLALDGSIISSVRGQLARLPDDTTHVVLSVGGNDALEHQEILMASAHSVGQVLDRFASIVGNFEKRYSAMLAEVLQRHPLTAVCTIYYPNFPDPQMQRLAVTASSFFNDVILREAFLSGIPVIDLRLIFNEATDYANPIEPSSSGGRKIVAAIDRVVTQHDFSRRRTEIYV